MNFLKSISLKFKYFILLLGTKIIELFNRARSLLSKISQNESIRRFISSKLVSRIAFALIILIALIEVVFGIMIYGFRSEDKITRSVAKVLPFPAAVVNYDVISYDSYLTEKDYIHHFYKATQQEKIDFKEVDKQVLNQLIENKLIGFQSLVNKVHADKSELDLTMKDIVEQNGGEEKVTKVLDDLYGLNLKQFRELVRTQMLRDELDEKLIARVSVKHILVRIDSNAPENKISETKAKADSILNEINGGLDFGEAAKKHSEDIGSAEQGGELEPFASGEMVPEFSKAAFSGKAGEIVGPIRSDFGWHIIKIEKKSGKVEKSFGEWLGDLKKKSLILNFIKL